ncbi:hypothetical protein HQQ94_06595 [Shewanella sp. VB17]|uniref:hypothetical protein n=1 Tax=Shewanella sp. VB17 TaxID=2739432 RepID=UPI001564AAC4|nr:hypothetical protein [Shewanella sp. VB17]NRD72912.1 hypothetical protein [Shewanella sp. VB17]
MLKFLSILGTTLLLLSSMSQADEGNVIHSSSYLAGVSKSFYIKFKLYTDGKDGGDDGFEWFGNITIRKMNNKDLDLTIWSYNEDDYTNSGQDDLVVEPNSAIVMSDAKEPYFTLEADLRDQDGGLTGNPDVICKFSSSYHITESDLNNTLTDSNSSLIYDDHSDCRFQLLRFERI